jgi:hypothetical protein
LDTFQFSFVNNHPKRGTSTYFASSLLLAFEQATLSPSSRYLPGKSPAIAGRLAPQRVRAGKFKNTEAESIEHQSLLDGIKRSAPPRISLYGYTQCHVEKLPAIAAVVIKFGAFPFSLSASGKNLSVEATRRWLAFLLCNTDGFISGKSDTRHPFRPSLGLKKKCANAQAVRKRLIKAQHKNMVRKWPAKQLWKLVEPAVGFEPATC